MTKLKKQILWAVIIILSASGYLFLNTLTGFYIPCLFHLITHLYCPGCGATRMVIALLKLNFTQAFFYNPLLFILILLYFPLKLLELITKKSIIKNKNFLGIVLGVVILFGIIRNIPGFEFLTPIEMR